MTLDRRTAATAASPPGGKDEADGKEDTTEKDKPADKKVRATHQQGYKGNHTLVRPHTNGTFVPHISRD